MSKPKFYIMVVIFLFACFAGQALKAQYILEMEEFDVPESVLWEIREDKSDLDDPDKRATYLVSLPESDYIKVAQKLDEPIDINKTTIYVDGNNFAVETMSPEGKMTMIHRDGMIYMVIWDEKKVVKTSKEEVQKMREDAMSMLNQAQQNMPGYNLEAMYEHLTKEQQEKLKEAMEQMKMARGGQVQTKQPVKEPSVTKTDQRRTILDLATQLYIAKSNTKTKGIWATSEDKELAAKFSEAGKVFKAAFDMQGGNEIEEWHLLPGKFPVVTATYKESMMGTASVKVQRYTKIDKRQPPENKLMPPGKNEGFTEGTMMDMMPKSRRPKR